MPKFSGFGKRKSTAENLNNAVAEPSFRVLERTEVIGKALGGARSSRTHLPQTSPSDIHGADNIFAGLKSSRGSGSSNTTKGTSTDTSSRYSNYSTAASSTSDAVYHDDPRNQQKKPYADIPIPPTPKSPSGFLRAAGRTFSFGGQKKKLHVDPPVPQSGSPPDSEPCSPQQTTPKRARAATTSTARPANVNSNAGIDIRDDMGNVLLGSEKRASYMALQAEAERQNLTPRSLTVAGRATPLPLQIDKTSTIEPPLWSWGSQHSADRLMKSSSPVRNGNVFPPPPRHGSPLDRGVAGTPSPDYTAKSPMLGRNAASDGENTDDEEGRLLQDSLEAVGLFMAANSSPSLEPANPSPRNDDVPEFRQPSGHSMASQTTSHGREDGGLFDRRPVYPIHAADRYAKTQPSPPPRTKVMTPAQFEKYRKDKERDNREGLDGTSDTVRPDDDVDDISYEDDDDDLEKAKQQTKQRQKQEAQMAVYRQQMTKVTGETTSSLHRSRPSLQMMTMSTPDLLNPGPSPASDNSDDDEEVPLAILAAHGFPSKNRPPTRLSTMMSNPNLRAASQPSYQRPGSVAVTGAPGGALPAFARKLPQDPFVGAGLVHNPVRESLALGGGTPVATQPLNALPNNVLPNNALPPGGLIGVIASEERLRAARRGSPRIEQQKSTTLPDAAHGAHVDAVTGIPAHLMYSDRTATLSPGDQAQMQMNQQMQQLMQMQMQFMTMQMMAGQNMAPRQPSPPYMHAASMGTVPTMNGFPGGMSQGPPDMMRHSFVGNDSMVDLSRPPNMHTRTMSMVQPSSTSWVQPVPNAGYVPSIRIQGNAYTPSIAPSERSNIGLPGRYRPVSMMPTPDIRPLSRMSGALGAYPVKKASVSVVKQAGQAAEDDDDEQGWKAMKARREKKMSLRKTGKSLSAGISALLG